MKVVSAYDCDVLDWVVDWEGDGWMDGDRGSRIGRGCSAGRGGGGGKGKRNRKGGSFFEALKLINFLNLYFGQNN